MRMVRINIPDEILQELIIAKQQKAMKYYFLFGSEACTYYDQHGVDFVVSLLSKRSIGCGVFCFEVGVTSPVDLLEAVSGWYDYRSITIDEYVKLNCND